ncbi:centromere protein X isoform X3 [Meriones unguiculatus]|uniref:centromere protein X isoform X3 n=1 Tax=Meriones unguiculatus TaxID=10047 RepID=UPI00293E8C22|nr:centromere protein X isoform X3 [Meriones unguiculatus]
MWEGSGERAQRQWPWRKPAASGRVISQRQAGLRGGGSRSRGVPFRDVLRLRVALLRPVLAQCGVRAHPPPGAGEQTTLSALQGLQDKSGDALQLMAEFLRIFVVAPGLLELPSCGLQSLQ